jgi:hypothetical protein
MLSITCGSVINPGEKQRIAKFAELLNLSEKWRDEYFGHLGSEDETGRLVTSLRAYLAHCRRLLKASRLNADDIDRRKRKIELACVSLWKATQRGKS